jgi:hypothetical protein
LLTEEVDRTESDCVVIGEASSVPLPTDGGGSCNAATSVHQLNESLQSSASQTTPADSSPVNCWENRPLSWKDFLVGYPTQSGEYFQL